jgi:hypothetical protein
VTAAGWRLCRAIGCALWLAAVPAWAQDMPDPSQVHGQPLPAGELPDGTVTVRVFREAIGNGVQGQRVRVTAAGQTFEATTDAAGRAEFARLPAGADARAESTVDGEELTSQPFRVPGAGGVRIALIAGIARAAERREQQNAAALAAPPVRGAVVFGGDTRIIAELQSDTLRFFYRLDVVNSARNRVDIGGPLIVELPRGAAGAALGPDPPATVLLEGTKLTIGGPFDPGTTSVEVSFSLPHSDPDFTVVQAWPAAVQQWLVAVERVGAVSLSSPQFTGTEERSAESGAVYMVAAGAPIAAGGTLTLQFSNLPVHGRVASRVAIGLAAALAALGVWLSIGARSGDAGARDAMLKRRDALLAKLAELEASHRAGRVADERYLSRRQRLLADLEQIYGELDEAGAQPRGGGEDVAA